MHLRILILYINVFSAIFLFTETITHCLQTLTLTILSCYIGVAINIGVIKETQKMVSSMEFIRLANWLMNQVLVKSCYGVARKIKSHGFDWGDPSSKPLQKPSSFPNIVKCDLEGRGSQTLACDFHKVLLRTHSFFPYFMLVAFEGGSIFRAFFLLCSCPILWILNYEMKLRVMIFISFCGLKVKDMENTSRAVLPKFYLENLNLEAYEVVASVGSRVFFTTMPRVMVEGFLKEYLNADAVIATELHTAGCYFTGLLSKSGLLVKHSALMDYFGDTKPDLGIGNTSLHDQLFISLCKVSLKLACLRLYYVKVSI